MTQTPGSETPDEPTAAPSEPAAAATPPPPSAPPDASTPPPGYTAPAATTTSGGGRLAISPIALGVCVIGAVLVLVSIFLHWIDFSVGSQSVSANGREVPLDFLWDHTTTSEDPSLIVALIPAGVLILAGALKQLRWLAAVGGLLAIVVAVLFLIQADALLGDAPSSIDLGYFDFIGIAPWFVLVGGILGVVGALVPRPTPSP